MVGLYKMVGKGVRQCFCLRSCGRKGAREQSWIRGQRSMPATTVKGTQRQTNQDKCFLWRWVHRVTRYHCQGYMTRRGLFLSCYCVCWRMQMLRGRGKYGYLRRLASNSLFTPFTHTHAHRRQSRRSCNTSTLITGLPSQAKGQVAKEVS